jgi:hypothetical protein
LLVSSPDLKTLNSARRSNRGVGLFLSLVDAKDPDAGSKLVTPFDLPHTPYTQVHTVLVLSGKRDDEPRLAIEFFRDQARTIGEWPTEPSKLMLPALKTSYQSLGLHFIFSAASLNLSGSYRFSHVIVVPTIADFSSVGLLGSLFVSSVPTALCSKKGTDRSGNPLYSVDYNKLLSEET